jgi:iron complex outermembrane recepter protein
MRFFLLLTLLHISSLIFSQSELKKTSDSALKENSTQLKEVIISANKKKASEYVAKMPLKYVENPQVYNTVSSELLKQQIITNYDDALKNVPGIHRLWESTGRGGDGGSYFTLRGFEAQVTMLNGLPGLSNGSLDPANLERIEVIKGPSGTLFGSSVIGYGGIINNVTKKPYDDFGGEVTYVAGSFGLNRVAADVNIPLNKEKGLAMRVNTAYQNENSFQDYGFRKSLFFAPTLSYKVNDRLSFLLVTEFMQEEKTNATMLFLGRESALQFTDLKDLNYNRKLSLTSNDLSMKNPTYNLQGQMNYKLSGNWTSQTVISRGQSKADGYYTYLYDNQNGMRDFSLSGTKENTQTTTSDIQQNFIGDFHIGSFRNRVVAGVDYYDSKISYSGTGWGQIHNVNAQGEVNYADPYNLTDTFPPVYLNKQSVDNLLGNIKPNPFSGATQVYSAYVSDVFNITPALSAMASLRVDYFNNKSLEADGAGYEQTSLSPKFGLVYQPVIDKISVFANYMNGFRNVSPGQVPVKNNNSPEPDYIAVVFEPEHANQFEAGVKTNLLKDKLTATISYYDINVSNLQMNGILNSVDDAQGGKTRSHGIEADLSSSPVRGLNIIAGYAYNISKIVEGDSPELSVETQNIWFEKGKRPIWAGPKTLINAWATYTFEQGKMKGFGLGIGGNYASDNATLNNTLTGVFILPAYTLINGSIFYNGEKVRVAFNLNNIGNKEYYGGGWSTVNPQKPRNFAMSVAYKF